MQSPIAKRPPTAFFELHTDRWTRPFWDAAAERRLTVPRCARCGDYRMPPTAFCPRCHSQELAWTELPGTGSVYSYTVVWHAILPEMQPCIPYVPAIIELDGAGGSRLVSNLVDVAVNSISIGARVCLIWDEQDGITVPRFTFPDAAS